MAFAITSPGTGEKMGIFYGLISSATFGLIPLFTLPLLAAGISADTALVYRFAIAAAVMCLILAARRENFAIGIMPFLKIGGLSVFYMLAVLFFFKAFNYLPSGLVATLQFLYPVMVMLIMVIFFHERFRWQTCAAVVLAVLGIALLSLGAPKQAPEGAVWTADRVAIGVILSLLAGLFNGLYFVGIKVARLPRINGLVMTFYVMLFGAFFCLANTIFTGKLSFISSGRELGMAMLLSLVTAVFSNLTLILAIRRVGPTLTSILGVMEPVTAMTVGIAVFAEPFTVMIAAGFAVIAVSVILALMAPKERHSRLVLKQS